MNWHCSWVDTVKFQTLVAMAPNRTHRKMADPGIAERWLHALNVADLTTSSRNRRRRSESDSSISRADKQTIAVDVRRSSAHWDIHEFMKTSKRISKRAVLNRLVEDLATTVPGFRYYQGVHEVSLVVLEVCGGDTEKAFRILSRLLDAHFGHFIRTDFHSSLVPMLDGLHYILGHFSPDLRDVLDQAGAGCHFAVPWILTWFAHSLRSFGDITTIYTFLLESSVHGDESTILYLCAAVAISEKSVIMQNRSDMCHVFKAIQSATERVDIRNAMELASAMKQALPWNTLRKECANISFLGTRNVGEMNILKQYLPAIIGATVTGISLAVAHACRRIE